MGRNTREEEDHQDKVRTGFEEMDKLNHVMTESEESVNADKMTSSSQSPSYLESLQRESVEHLSKENK